VDHLVKEAPLSAHMRTADWPELAQGKLCEYTATLIGNADRDGTPVPEKGPHRGKSDHGTPLIRTPEM
jgi:hypothetical protein